MQLSCLDTEVFYSWGFKDTAGWRWARKRCLLSIKTDISAYLWLMSSLTFFHHLTPRSQNNLKKKPIYLRTDIDAVSPELWQTCKTLWAFSITHETPKYHLTILEICLYLIETTRNLELPAGTGRWSSLCTQLWWDRTSSTVFSFGPLTTRKTSRPWSTSREGQQSCEGSGAQILWGAAEGAGIV